MSTTSKYVAELEVDSSGAISNLNKVDTAVNETAESTSNLKTQIRELQKQLNSGNLSPEKYEELTARMGALKDQVKETAEAVSVQAGSAFENVGGSAGLLSSALLNLDFDGASKAANLLAKNVKGINFKSLTSGSNEFGKSMLNLGKALLTNPIILLGTVLALIITNFDKILNVVPGVAAVFEAVGAVIGFIIEKIKAFTDLIGLTAFEAQGALDKAISAKEQAVSDLDRQEKRQLAQAKKNGENITKVEEDFAKKRIAVYQQIIDKSAELTRKGAKLTQDQVDATREAKEAIFDIETEAIEKEAAIAEKARSEKAAKDEKAKQDSINKAKEAKAKAEQERKEIETRQQSVRDAIAESNEQQYQDTLSATDKEIRLAKLKYDKLYEQAKGNSELQAQVLAEYEEVRLQILQKFTEAEAKLQLEATKAALFAENEARIEAQDAQFTLEQELARARMTELEAAKDLELQELNAEYEAKYLIALNNAELTKQLEEQQKQDLLAIDKDYAKQSKDIADAKRSKEIEDEQAVLEAKLGFATDSLNIISSLTSTFAKNNEKSQKRAFEIQKAISISQAIIDTYKSANAIFASAAANPTSILFPAQPFIAAGLAIAGGLANVAKIKATQFGSGSTSSGGTPSIPSPGGGGGVNAGANQFNPFNTSFLQNRPGQTAPAYVLASDVVNTVEARNKVEEKARIFANNTNNG
jgi:DNA repair exonuclease SbcCD ATPase subunit